MTLSVPDNKAIAGLIGLAKRAGKLVAGREALQKAILSEGLDLLIIAEDAAPATVKELVKLAKEQSVEMVFYASKEELGNIIGYTASAAVGINDSGFASRLKQIMPESRNSLP